MTMQATMIRTTTVTAVVAAALSWGGSSQAADPVPVSASISAVTCVDGDGTVDVTLSAGDGPASFAVYLDGVAYADGSAIGVAAGEQTSVNLTGLSDDDHTIAVDLLGAPDTETEPQTLATETRTPACDPVPEGAYTNARGSVSDFCTSALEVTASNRPIGGNTADLQPATFTLTIEPFADETGGDEPGDTGTGDAVEPRTTEDLPDPVIEDPGFELLDPIVLDTFTLDADTPTYEKSFSYDQIGHTGLVTLRAGETVIASGYFYGECIVAAAGSGGGAGVPNTGA